MKILLVAINAKYIHSNLAVYSLKAYAKKQLSEAADGIELKEYTINQELQTILSDIYLTGCEVVCFSCYIWNMTYVCELTKMLHIINPALQIFFGGPEVSYHPEELLNSLPVVGIMVAEGEETFTDLARYYLTGEGMLSEIRGLAMRDQVFCPREELSMDVLPFVYQDLPWEMFENRIVYYESSRGCPFRCSYCLSSIDKRLRFRSLDLVKRELDFFLSKKVRQVKFIDRTFNCDDKRALEIWNYIKEHDNKVTNFHFEIATEIMTEEQLSLLKSLRPGLIQLEIGVQTTNEVTLSAINRKMAFDTVSHVMEELLPENNIHLHLDLIAGLPDEDYISFQKSFHDVYSLHPHELQLGFLKVLYGTPVEQLAKQGMIVHQPFPPYEVLFTKWLSFEEVICLKSVEEMLEIYYNSGQFVHSIRYLETIYESLDKLYYALYYDLARFYQEKGYDYIQPSRVKKYEILLQFALEKLHVRETTICEYLTLDLYLRENMKKRPDFSADLTAEKQLLRSLYTGNLLRESLPEYAHYDNRQLERMVHAEIFTEIFGEKTIVLFDYKNREPIYNNAKLLMLSYEHIKGSLSEIRCSGKKVGQNTKE